MHLLCQAMAQQSASSSWKPHQCWLGTVFLCSESESFDVCFTNSQEVAMTLVKFNPFEGFDSLVRRMNEWMSELDRSLASNGDSSVTLVPRVDISEDKENFYISAELPGIPKEQIKVVISDDGVLTISGEKKHEEKTEDKNFYRIERRYGMFTRSFTLPENVKRDGISARYENGVLHLVLPKQQPAQPKLSEVPIS
jgi:HSP20 family protein